MTFLKRSRFICKLSGPVSFFLILAGDIITKYFNCEYERVHLFIGLCYEMPSLLWQVACEGL